MPRQEQQITLFELGERLPGVEDASKNLSAAPDAQSLTSTFRTWTDSTGRHKIEAKLIAVKQGFVKLEKKDGSTIVLAINKLSQADQKLLKP